MVELPDGVGLSDGERRDASVRDEAKDENANVCELQQKDKHSYRLCGVGAQQRNNAVNDAERIVQTEHDEEEKDDNHVRLRALLWEEEWACRRGVREAAAGVQLQQVLRHHEHAAVAVEGKVFNNDHSRRAINPSAGRNLLDYGQILLASRVEWDVDSVTPAAVGASDAPNGSVQHRLQRGARAVGGAGGGTSGYGG